MDLDTFGNTAISTEPVKRMPHPRQRIKRPERIISELDIVLTSTRRENDPAAEQEDRKKEGDEKRLSAGKEDPQLWRSSMIK